MLMAAFAACRPTRDIDLAARGLPGEESAVLEIVRRVARIPCDDGLLFDADGARAESIRDDDKYAGVRVTLLCGLDRAVLRFHVDVNVGDPIWPDPVRVALPRVLGDESVEVLGYPLAMVLAEKLVTAVEREPVNTRWRDFADVYLLTRVHDQDGGELVTSITTVAQHRKVQVTRLAGALSGLPNLAQPCPAALGSVAAKAAPRGPPTR